MDKTVLAEVLKSLGKALSCSEENKNFWIGEAIQELSKLVNN